MTRVTGRADGNSGPAQRAARFVRPFAERLDPRTRAAFPLALVDFRPVTFPTSSSTRPANRSSAPSPLLRRELLAMIKHLLRLPGRTLPRQGTGQTTAGRE